MSILLLLLPHSGNFKLKGKILSKFLFMKVSAKNHWHNKCNFKNEIGDILVLGTILNNVPIKNAYINNGQPSSKLEVFKVSQCR
jgi:hypothetical protein